MVLIMLLTGCGSHAAGEDAMKWVETAEEAIVSSDESVVEVRDLWKVGNGLGTAVRGTIVVRSATDVDEELMRGVLEAVWNHTPFEPNAIRITAKSHNTGDMIDLMPVATDMSEHAGPFGNRGASFSLVHTLLGPHPTKK